MKNLNGSFLLIKSSEKKIYTCVCVYIPIYFTGARETEKYHLNNKNITLLVLSHQYSTPTCEIY